MLDLQLHKGDFVEEPIVAVQLGEAQKIARLAPSRTFRFDEVGSLRYGKVEVFRRLAGCELNLKSPGSCPVPFEPASECRGVTIDTFAAASSEEDDEEGLRKRDMDAKGRSAQAYADKHKLESVLSGAMNDLILARPENAAAFLAEKLLECRAAKMEASLAG